MCYVLAVALIAHLTVRGYWIGLIGLKSHFPKGIDWQRLPQMGPVSRAFLKARDGGLDGSIERADRLATMLFSTTLLAVQTLAGTLVMAVLTLCVAMAISALAGGSERVVMIVVISVLTGLLALALVPALLERVIAPLPGGPAADSPAAPDADDAADPAEQPALAFIHGGLYARRGGGHGAGSRPGTGFGEVFAVQPLPVDALGTRSAVGVPDDSLRHDHRFAPARVHSASSPARQPVGTPALQCAARGAQRSRRRAGCQCGGGVPVAAVAGAVGWRAGRPARVHADGTP
ncbi:hypothetical protein G6F40_013122 [Rhizopus arrhizus]|nr:hypothetical protein G6F40_013122 [Rhizopus arrhizus]